MLRNPFRKKDIEKQRREADALFDEGRFGEAKLAYDRLAARAQKDPPELLEAAETRVAECCDKLALKRAADALELHAAGQDELAQEELRHALEVVRSESALAQVREIERRLEKADAVEQAREAAPLSDEERLLLITSSWEPLQAEELESYGEPFLQAAIALELGEAERALALLLPLSEHASARYLWLEIGRAHLTRAALDEAEAALRKFLSRIAADEGGAPRLMAHRELARIAHERDDRDGAVAELEAACEALSDDPRPLLDLGNYLRTIERAHDAIEVLELCAAAFGDNEVEWPVTMELGLACAAAGQDERARVLLEGVLDSLLAKGQSDLPPIAVVGLAAVHEKAGNLARAADLYRALTQGSDSDNHARYHLEAARLLDVLKLTDEAERMRDRARALAGPTPVAVDTTTPPA
ncbi:MAG: domain protein putative component of TonB system [Myxococcaceae bacterium]|nr:domain protein putative component of TonB system [Myxococcaceae bacterium]